MYKYGSKERLFEIMDRVNKTVLCETILPKDRKLEIINLFVKFVDEEVKIGDNKPTVEITHNPELAGENKSFATYYPNENHIIVCANNRNLADVLRSLAHELVHAKQRNDGMLSHDSGNTGSEQENEANSMAGILLRNFGKSHPEIYE